MTRATARLCVVLALVLAGAAGVCRPVAGAAVSAAPLPTAYVNGSVYAIAIAPDGTVYFGGRFSEVCTDSALACVARSNVARLSAAGDVLPALGTGTNNTVRALAVGASEVYAGGEFTIAGGEGIGQGVARWTGVEWHSLASGLSGGSVDALAVAGDTLYAGGSFTRAGDHSVANIAQWNGESWDPVGAGTQRPVLALAASGAGVYAGGAFDSAGQVPGTAHIARWDGSAWQPLGGGTPGFADEVHSIVVSGTNVYIAGDFTEAGGVAGARNVARWDGAQWRALATGVDGHVSALAVAGGDLYAAGEFTSVGGTATSRLAYWDGVGWHAVGEGANGHIEALVPAPDRATLFAGGSFTKFNGATRVGLTAFGAPHTGAPVVTLTIRAQHLSYARVHGVLARFSCDEPCTATLRTLIGSATAGRAVVFLTTAGPGRVRIPFDDAARRALKGKKSIKLTVSMTATDHSGNSTKTARDATLKG